MPKPAFRALWSDNRASVIVEFAILAPVIFALMLGVLQIGLQMHNYNAVRSVASETARYTIVEYQKGNKVNLVQIQSKGIAYGVNPPYMLNSDNLTVTATNPATDITGTVKYSIQVSYIPNTLLGFLGIGSPTITVTRPAYVKP